LTIQTNCAFIRLHDATNNIHERTFARAIFSDET
jgi:hypothetical protein